MSEPRGKLAAFKKRHPEVEIRLDIGRKGDCEVFWRPRILGVPIIIDRFSRDRDAWRRLRQLGYTREGEVWRLVPKQQQAIPPLPAAIQGIAPIFNSSDI